MVYNGICLNNIHTALTFLERKAENPEKKNEMHTAAPHNNNEAHSAPTSLLTVAPLAVRDRVC